MHPTTHNPFTPPAPSHISSSSRCPPQNPMLFRDFFLSIMPPSLRVLGGPVSGRKRFTTRDPPPPSPSDAATSALLIDDWKQAFQREKKASALHAAALHKTKVELQRAQEALGACKREMARMDAEADGLRREVERKKREANELRAFFPGADSGPGTPDAADQVGAEARVVELVRGVNDEIARIVGTLADTVTQAGAGDLVSGPRTPAAERACVTVGAWVGPGVVQLLRADAASALKPALQACAVNWARRVVMDWIFGAEPVVDALRELDERVGKAETEPIARRWRALTRKHTREASSQSSTRATETHLSVHGVEFLALTLLSAGYVPTLASARTMVDTHADAGVRRAMKLAMETNGVLGEDAGAVGSIEPYIVEVGSAFDPVTMECGMRIEADEGGRWGVLCTTELGLRAKRGMGEDASVILKPKVVLCRLEN
ncbi:hypothetical protein OF83DRAFT_1171358 [Amylostereum chailletii]|nr:hypothetical protein OF83DRAFT_1171358 [Amylostereum chailletii]